MTRDHRFTEYLGFRTVNRMTSAVTSAVTSAATFDSYLDNLGFLIARGGIAGFESDISRLVVHLRATGLCGPLTDVLDDRHAPAVARERAFGRLMVQLADAPAQREPCIDTAA
jgi:hypothetical protein